MNLTDTILHILKETGYLAVPASLAISIIIAVAGIIPSLFVTGANVLFFGPLNGFLISWLGEVAGAAFSFHLYRSGFKKRFEIIKGKHPLIQMIMDASGKKSGLLIFQARLLPFIPSGIVTLAASISGTGFIIFLTASAAGKIPSILLEALVSYDIINFNENWIRLLLTVLAVMPAIFILKKKNDKTNTADKK
jgi:uncharacterized membrane protein YdjX (TVP38/TMEM64 family)